MQYARTLTGSFRSLLLIVCSLGMSILCFLPPSAGAAATSAIAQQFKVGANSGVTAAALVGSAEQQGSTVELASSAKSKRLVGVVSDTSAIELSDGGTGVRVVTSGITMALVSDLNGAPHSGDKITASPVEGVGMRATESGTIVGVAQSDLDTSTATRRTVTTTAGSGKTIHIGLVPVQVDVAYYSIASGNDSPYVPPVLQAWADKIAGRNVSALRVLAAGLVLLIVVASVAALLYGAVRSSIISIGRNPLSAVAVRKSLFHVALTAFGVLLFAGLSIYLILTV